jgi:hypothetical protein
VIVHAEVFEVVRVSGFTEATRTRRVAGAVEVGDGRVALSRGGRRERLLADGARVRRLSKRVDAPVLPETLPLPELRLAEITLVQFAATVSSRHICTAAVAVGTSRSGRARNEPAKMVLVRTCNLKAIHSFGD